MSNSRMPSHTLGDVKSPGFEKTWSAIGEKWSETTAFFTKPKKKIASDERTATCSRKTRFSTSCGMNCTARTIGPATSCGKKATKSASS